MKAHDMIVRLRAIRQLREERAGEVVLRRQGAAKRAAMLTEQASAAVAAHVEQVAEDERSAHASLVGQSVSPANLYLVQGRFEKAADETAALRDRQTRAAAEEEQRRTELSGARATHRDRRQAVAKLDGLMEQTKKRAAARQVALAELADEEDRGPSYAPKPR